MPKDIVILTTNGEKTKAIYSQVLSGTADISTHGESKMNIPIDKYLDSKFAGLEGKLDAHLNGINQRFERIESDIREVRVDIKSQLKWIIGIGIAIISLVATIVFYYTATMQNQFNYHQASIQAQMQSFSDYVKAITQPQIPQSPRPSK